MKLPFVTDASADATRARRRHRHQEDDLQKAVMQFLRLVLDPAEYRAFAIPNGGRRDAREGARLKAAGVLPGVPDIGIQHRSGVMRYMEIKTPTGRLTAPQEDFRNWGIAGGLKVAVVRSIDDARSAVTVWGLRTREAA